MTQHPARAALVVPGNPSKADLSAAIERHALFVAADLNDVRLRELTRTLAVVAAIDTGLALFLYDAGGTAPDDGVAGVHDANGRVFARDRLVLTSTLTTLLRSAHGAETRAGLLEEELTLAGAFVASTVQIPAGSLVWAVSERVTQLVTGATSFGVGISGTPGKFGSALSLALGSTNRGLIGPDPFYADTPVRITSAGGNFTGGKVRIAIHYWQPEPPAS